MAYIRSGDYIVKVTGREQLSSAFWCFLIGVILLGLSARALFALALSFWLLLTIPIGLFFLYSSWRAIANWWDLLGAEGDAIYGKRK